MAEKVSETPGCLSIGNSVATGESEEFAETRAVNDLILIVIASDVVVSLYNQAFKHKHGA